MVIDFHTHTFPDKIAAQTVEHLSHVSHTTPFSDGTADGLRASMARAGVDLSVMLPVATSPKQVSRINEASVVYDGSDGLLSFACMHPDLPDWHDELSRIRALGYKGFKLHPVYQGVDLDDLRTLRILSRAAELGLIVVTHAGIDIGYPGVFRCTPRMARHVVDEIGSFPLVLAHMGGWRSWDEATALLVDTAVWLDTSFSTGALSPLPDGHYTPDELPLMDEADFLAMVEAFGTERLLFGTDSPWSDQRDSLGWMRALPLPDDKKAAILGGNAQRLLGI